MAAAALGSTMHDPIGGLDSASGIEGDDVGRPYESELAALPETYAWARSLPVDPLSEIRIAGRCRSNQQASQ